MSKLVEQDNTIELLQAIDSQYTAVTQLFRDASQNAEADSVVRDVYVLFKKTLRRMHRLNPTWKTMHHGVFGVDDDEMGSTRVVVGTDVTFMLTHEEALRLLFVVETIDGTAYTEMPRLLDPVDLFLDEVERYSPNLPDDLLICSNFIGHAETLGYKMRQVEYLTEEGQAPQIKMTMSKKDRGIVLMYHPETPILDISQLVKYYNSQGERVS